MAQTVSQEALRAAVQRHLQPDEILRYAVYGVYMPLWKLLLALSAAVMVAGLIMLALPVRFSDSRSLPYGPVGIVAVGAAIQIYIRKDYILALTSRRLLLLRVKVPLFSIDLDRQLEMRQWPDQARPNIEVDLGTVWTNIRILDPANPVRFRVVHFSQKGGKAQARGLAAV